MTDETEASRPPLSVEIIHNGDYDILLNTRHKDQQKIRQLAEIVREGLPTNWVGIVAEDSEDGDPPRTFVDNPQNPQFFAKIRKMADPKILEIVLDKGEYKNFSKREIQAFNSLVNEFAISVDVKRVLTLPGVKEVIRDYGFQDVELIEPLVGINDRKTGKKIMVYDFVEADRGFEPQKPGVKNMMFYLTDTARPPNANNLADDLGSELREVFKENGIEATDLKGHQFLSSKDDGSGHFKLYLLDVEGYHKVPV